MELLARQKLYTRVLVAHMVLQIQLILHVLAVHHAMIHIIYQEVLVFNHHFPALVPMVKERQNLLLDALVVHLVPMDIFSMERNVHHGQHHVIFNSNMNHKVQQQHKTEYAWTNYVLVQMEHLQQAQIVKVQKQNVHLVQLVDTKLMVPVKNVTLLVQLNRHQDFHLLVFHAVLDKQH